MPRSTQRFRAASARDALALVKRALGPEAVILATRTVPARTGGKPLIEITAAPPDGFEFRVSSFKFQEA
ncbi:MAG: hypothetical protein AB1716_15935, partial [Planctomycetota bacterium]